MKYRILCLCGVLGALSFSACSINKLAINAVSNALTAEGSSDVFTGDSDPQLVGDAIPFAIKVYESLLSANPNHQGLILTTGSLFVMYANAFVQGPAEFLSSLQYKERAAAMDRAKQLYLRGAGILIGGLDKKYPGFRDAGEKDLEPFLKKFKKEDVGALYWTAAGYLSAFGLDPFDSALGLRVPVLMRCLRRAYELNPDFNRSALDEFYIIAYASLPETMGGNPALAEVHFRRALEKSGGALAGPYVSYAQSVSIPAQDYDTFKKCLDAALAVDVDADPANRLVNIISRRKAQTLLERASDYFFLEDDGEWVDEEWDDAEEEYDE
ncbi:MAG: TRAP transporter TatT component family protein [Treponema sp.]|jgi:predicted anti-sigma-YlaC factor YlaD|nr:TRAP transporter TatT component family protein [Treponema sp.]